MTKDTKTANSQTEQERTEIAIKGNDNNNKVDTSEITTIFTSPSKQ